MAATSMHPRPSPFAADSAEGVGLAPPDEVAIGPRALRAAVDRCWPYWPVVLAGALIGFGLGLARVIVTPPRYTAEALMVLTGTRTDVLFEPTIKTVGANTPQDNKPAVLSPERVQAVADLAGSPMVEPGAIARLQAMSNGLHQFRPGTLLSRVTVALKPRSEIVSIQAQADTSGEAIDIANAWSASAVEAVGRVYGPDPSGATLANLQTQRDAALAANQAAEAKLADRMQNDRLEASTREMANKEHQLSMLLSAYQAGAYTPPDDAALIDTQTARDDYRGAELQTINNIAQTLRHLDSMRVALAVLDQGDSSTTSPSDAAAVLLAQMQLASIDSSLGTNVTLQVPATTNGGTTSVQDLIARVDRARAEVAQALESRQAAYESSRLAQISQLQDDLRALRAETEAAKAQRNALIFSRDLAWTNYTALARKMQEQTVALSASQSEVTRGSQSTSALAYTPAAALTLIPSVLAGLVLGVLVALLLSRQANAPSRMVPQAPPALVSP